MGRSLLRLLPRILVLNAGHAFDFACTIAVKPIRHRAMNGVIRVSALSVGFCFAISQTFDLTAATPAAEPGELHALVAQPVDISSSAYQYRADRNADANDPESWIALLHYAKLPLNKAPDGNQPAVKRVLCGLLWEEIRPVQQIELIWAANAKRRPAPEELTITTLTSRGTASTWWNNTGTLPHTLRPTVSADRRRYLYDLKIDTCGIVVSLAQGKQASNYDVPTVRVLVPDVWKKMDVEIEWAFDRATAVKNYSGRLETYDGRVGRLHPLADDASTNIAGPHAWQSRGESTARRGIRFPLLYMGTAKWRKEQPYTSQPDDVARTIVTLWTKGGNFSFLAADLENGPILRPSMDFSSAARRR